MALVNDMGQTMGISKTVAKAKIFKGFMQSLRTDVAGNALLWTAAAVVPLFGLMGGAFDLSRMYLVRNRVQAACDAGALTARRTMGSSNTLTTEARQAGQRMFAANFSQNSFGSQNYTFNLTANGSQIGGTATVPVNMYLVGPALKRTGMSDLLTINVTCMAELRIPHTDVMFVLDVTGSMNCAPGETNTGSTGACANGHNNNTEKSNSKMIGLRTAVKCFYESLAKQNTSDAGCTATPTVPLSTQTQLRFGFVPYSSNVNVGRVLANGSFATNWTYQSREAVTETVRTWVEGTETARTWSGYSPASTPADSFFGWTATSSWGAPGSIPSGYTASRAGTTQAACDLYTGSSIVPDPTDVPGTPTTSSTNSGAPTYIDGSPGGNINDDRRVYNYTETTPRSVRQWDYRVGGNPVVCRLRTRTATYNQTRTAATQRPLDWDTHNDIVKDWVYKPRTFNVSALHTGSWPRTISLPVSESALNNVYVSGSTAIHNYRKLANVNVTWDGCLEERPTMRMSTSNPSTTDIDAAWTTIPSGAWDMNIPDGAQAGNTSSFWGPAFGRTTASGLPGSKTATSIASQAVFRRYDTNGDEQYSNRTITSKSAATTFNTQFGSAGLSCPSPAANMTRVGTGAGEWTATNFEQYVDDLYAVGSTYHDIGLVWGARLMWPNGMFAAQNATGPGGTDIQRHVVFMTDGDSSASDVTYGMHGMAWWDRRQTAVADAPTNDTLTDLINARFIAVCNAIKNHSSGIRLWVVSFGGGVNAANETRLAKCSSDNADLTATGKNKFYQKADNNAKLIQTFEEIANQISELRITS